MEILSFVIGIIFVALWLAFLAAPFYFAYQLDIRFATDKKPRWTTRKVFVYALLWFLLVAFSLPFLPFPFFDVPFVLLLGWTVGLWRFVSGFQFEPVAVAVGLLSLMLFFVSLHYLLRGILKPYGKTWTFAQTSCVGGILLAMSISGIALLAGIHEVYWIATAKESWFTHPERYARRMVSASNAKQLALGMLSHNNHDQTPLFGGTILPDGRLGHSWETQILPYIEQTALYNQIDMTKTWTDSAHRPVFETRLDLLASLMVSRADQHNAAGYALSFYAVNERLLPVGESVTFESITSGTSNTMLLGEVKGNVRAWGDPVNGRDPALGINQSPYGFGGYFKGGANIGLCDGSVRFVSDTVAPEVMRALATPDEGTVEL
ncbi:MAG: DUF1559 domain-containing protein [Planctomycetaceae bacterium]|jgi:prepilin-type processing-associated H-X9-DG protein|nr:DUF1559 domain-containing protein [Planctomycetaceae bacterium]